MVSQRSRGVAAVMASAVLLASLSTAAVAVPASAERCTDVAPAAAPSDDPPVGLYASQAPSPDPSTAMTWSVSFTTEEKTLQRAIPWRIRETCVPRRSALPSGTVAALQCRPAVPEVRDMAYYLLDGGAAGRVFEQRRVEAGVDTGRRCVAGKPSVTYWIGGMPTSELCYRNEDGRANLRFLERATDCRQLTVGGRTLRTPTIYVAVLGQDRDIASLADWATDGGQARPSILTRIIDQPGSRQSPSCPR